MNATDDSVPTELRCGRVALVGWTNVGKSTLLNRLVGTKLAAVGDVAQTTRHRIVGVRNLPRRGQIVFVDTPGLHRPKHRMNRAMVEQTRETLAGVDRVVLVVDAAFGIGAGDLEAAALLQRADVNRLLALNKIDRVRPKTRLLPMVQTASEELGFEDVVPISAQTGEGCDALLDVLISSLPPGPPAYDEDYLTDQPERALAAEWIREKLLNDTRQELPHATAIEVERWHERDDGLLEIDATVLVERESQKPIVIGAGGERLRRIGSAARQELEAFLERRIYLSLWVKVRPHWRDDANVLLRLGLGDAP
jgi:GTP-binding protein Era